MLTNSPGFFDTAVPALMEELHIVGAVVGVSDRSNTLFLRGYGSANLNGGQLTGARILKEETIRKMRKPSFHHDPRANGIAHGFFELSRGDVVVFGHGGELATEKRGHGDAGRPMELPGVSGAVDCIFRLLGLLFRVRT
jgi:hypothetical protein